MRSELDPGMLSAALAGYQSRLAAVNARIKELREYLAAHAPSMTGGIGRKKHNVSAEGRARIAAAQRRRWAKVKARTIDPAA